MKFFKMIFGKKKSEDKEWEDIIKPLAEEAFKNGKASDELYWKTAGKALHHIHQEDKKN